MNLYTKMKKAAGAVLAVAMGMTCIPTPLAVYAQEPEEYTVILEENFESELSAGVKLSGGGFRGRDGWKPRVGIQ